MSGPKRIQRKRTKGWRMPEGAVSVCRPSIWGNPFTHHDPAVAVEAYGRLIGGGTQSFSMGPEALQFAKGAHPDTLHWSFAGYVREHIHQLRGKDLACWCALDQPCHADVLLRLANEGQANGQFRPEALCTDQKRCG